MLVGASSGRGLTAPHAIPWRRVPYAVCGQPLRQR